VPAHAVKHRQQDYTRVSPVPDVLSRWPPVLFSLSLSLPLPPPSSPLAHGWRRCPVESWMKLYEQRGGALVNLASERSHLLIVIPRKFTQRNQHSSVSHSPPRFLFFLPFLLFFST